MLSPQQTLTSPPDPGMMPPPPTWQLSPAAVSQAAQPQLESVLFTQTPPQQLWPGLPPMPKVPATGAVQATPLEPQPQLPPEQVSPPAHAVPHMPQFIASRVTSTQPPPQQAWPPVHAAPVPPQPQLPPTQLSPSAQALPTVPQLAGSLERSAQVKVPLLLAQTWPTGHWAKLPHRHWGGPLPPSCCPQTLARSASQARPQPLQLEKEVSLRPSSTPAGA